MNDRTKDRFEGSLLGLALGDALGAPLEGGPVEHFVWGLIGKTRKGELRWTDDTQMSLDLAESLVAKGGVDPDDLAVRFAKGYRFSRGYGPGAAKLLKRISKGADWREANRSIFPDGSYGNGGAMRVAPVGLFYSARPEQLVKAARQSARVTHAHPLGIEGAVLVAAATAQAVSSKEPVEILQAAAAHCELDPFIQRLAIARAWLDSGQVPPTKDVSQQLGNGIAAARHVSRPFTSPRSFWASHSSRCKASWQPAAEMSILLEQWPGQSGARPTGPRPCRRTTWRDSSNVSGYKPWRLHCMGGVPMAESVHRAIRRLIIPAGPQ